jgi:ketosteroid isomerase-like protein
MTGRAEIETLLRNFYAARVRGDFRQVLETFAPNAKFEISGPSEATSVSAIAVGVDEFSPLLAAMVKTFTLTDYSIIAILIDGENAAVHWRAKVRSNITGKTAVTEFVDLVHIRDWRIASYMEFFVKR